MEGIDRVAEAALFAHLLEQARAHAAAQDRCQDLRGIKAVGIVGAAFEADDDMGLFVVGQEALLAPLVFGPLRRRGTIGLERREALAGNIDQPVMIDIAGGGDDHVVAHIVAVHVFADRVRGEFAHRIHRAQDGAANRLGGECRGLEQVEDMIIRVVARRADLLDDDLLLAGQFVVLEQRILQDI